MQPLHVRWITAFAVLLTVISVPNTARAQDAEVVIEWNRIWQAAQATPGAQSPTIFFTRPFAIVHIAMFDALNSIDPHSISEAMRGPAWGGKECCHSSAFSTGAPVRGPFPLHRQEVGVWWQEWSQPA